MITKTYHYVMLSQPEINEAIVNYLRNKHTITENESVKGFTVSFDRVGTEGLKEMHEWTLSAEIEKLGKVNGV